MMQKKMQGYGCECGGGGVGMYRKVQMINANIHFLINCDTPYYCYTL